MAMSSRPRGPRQKPDTYARAGDPEEGDSEKADEGAGRGRAVRTKGTTTGLVMPHKRQGTGRTTDTPLPVGAGAGVDLSHCPPSSAIAGLRPCPASRPAGHAASSYPAASAWGSVGLTVPACPTPGSACAPGTRCLSRPVSPWPRTELRALGLTLSACACPLIAPVPRPR